MNYRKSIIRSFTVHVLALWIILLFPLHDIHAATLNVTTVVDLQAENLSPNEGGYTPHEMVLANLFAALLVYDENGRLTAANAKSWEYQKDGMELHVELDPAYRWSNGDPVLAEDFVRGAERAVSSEKTLSLFEFVSNGIAGVAERAAGDPTARIGVRAEGDLKLVYELVSPYSLAISDLAISGWAAPYSAKDAMAGTDWLHSPHRLSNGPYKLVDIEPGRITIAANPFFPGGTPDFDKVIWHDSSARDPISRYVNGQTDILLGPFGNQQSWLFERYSDHMVSLFQPRMFVVLVNRKIGTLDNNELRKAMFLALDRERFGKGLFKAAYRGSLGILPDDTGGYSSEHLAGLWPATFDERYATARALADKAGINAEQPLKLRLVFAKEVQGYEQIAEFLKVSWRGLNIELEPVEVPTFADALARYDEGHDDLTIVSGWIFDALNYFKMFAYPSGHTGYDVDEQMRKLILNARSQTSQTGLIAAYQEIDRYMMETLNILPIAASARVAFINDRIDMKNKSAMQVHMNYLNIRRQ